MLSKIHECIQSVNNICETLLKDLFKTNIKIGI